MKQFTCFSQLSELHTNFYTWIVTSNVQRHSLLSESNFGLRWNTKPTNRLHRLHSCL